MLFAHLKRILRLERLRLRGPCGARLPSRPMPISAACFYGMNSAAERGTTRTRALLHQDEITHLVTRRLGICGLRMRAMKASPSRKPGAIVRPIWSAP
jgi:hypothetical protein